MSAIVNRILTVLYAIRPIVAELAIVYLAALATAGAVIAMFLGIIAPPVFVLWVAVRLVIG